MAVPPTGSPRSERRGAPWLLLLALLATLAAYARAFAGELVYDDLHMIARNPGIRSLAGIPELFTQGYWDFLGEENAGYNGYWRPLTATVLALAHAVGGGSVAVFHGACILVHLGATWAAFSLARRLLGRDEPAFFAALLFGLHPLHVESVAWITALNDPLFGLLGLLSLISFLRWRERGSIGAPWAAASFFALGLMAKELAMSVLPMLLVVDWLRPRGADEPTTRFLAPKRAYAGFGVVLLGYYLARVAVFGEPTAGLERVTTFFGVDAWRLALLRIELFGGGLGLLAWPANLNVFRPFHPTISFSHPALYGAVIAIAVWGALLVRARMRRCATETLTLLFAAAGILPILGRVASLGRFPLSDRFLYLPVLGFAMYLSVLVPRLLPRTLARGALVLVAAVFAVGTWQRVEVWSDEEALFRSGIHADARSPYAHWGLGRVLLQEYQATNDLNALGEAFTVFDRAMELVQEALNERDSTDIFLSSTDVLQVNLGYGWCLVFEAQIDEYNDFDTPIAVFEQLAERIYQIRGDADAARAAGIQVWGEPLDAASVHVALGVAHMLAGRLGESESAFRNALSENIDSPEAHHNYGRLLMRGGEFDRAIHHFERAVELRPGEYRDRLWLSKSLIEGGWTQRAEDLARELHAERPDEPDAMLVLAICRTRSADWSGALRWLDMTLAVAPTFGGAWYQRASVLLKLNETQEAIESFRRAVDITPDDFHVRFDFASTLLSNGAVDAAVPHAVQAYGLCRDPNLYLQLRETLRSLPVSPEDATTLASIDRSRQQYDSALEWVDRALELAPNDGQALLQRGRVLLDLGRDADAIESLRRACQALPGSFVPRFELGAILAQREQVDAALEYLREARAVGTPATWTPEESKGALDRLDRMIDEMEGAALRIGPPAGD